MKIEDLMTEELQQIRRKNLDPEQVEKAENELKRRGVLLGSRIFLQRFEGSNLQSTITTWFLVEGEKNKEFSPEQIVENVRIRRKETIEEERQWRDEKYLRKCNLLLTVLDEYPQEAREYAVWIKGYLELPKEEREKLKNRNLRESSFHKNIMEKEPPTLKQLQFLKILGFEGQVKTKLEASELISNLKKEKEELERQSRLSGAIKFVVNGPERDYSKEGDFSRIHIAEQSIVSGFPEWRKVPYCRNGGLDLKYWVLIELFPRKVHPSQVCKVCLHRLEVHKINLNFGTDLLGTK